jgi:hypothetical protein
MHSNLHIFIPVSTFGGGTSFTSSTFGITVVVLGGDEEVGGGVASDF